MTNTEVTREVVTRFYASLAAGDLKTGMACVHPDFELSEPGYLPYGGIHKGPDALRAVFREVARWVDVKSVKIRTLIVDGDNAVAMMDAAVRKTGVPVLAAETWTVQDGLICAGQVFFFDHRPIIEH
jgi:ketosteroid isomerase-like protein